MSKGVDMDKEKGKDVDLGILRLMRVIDATDDVEIDCTTCLDLVPLYVDTELAGADAARALPQLRQHLTLCGDCREEYEALRDLAALDAAGALPDAALLLRSLNAE